MDRLEFSDDGLVEILLEAQTEHENVLQSHFGLEFSVNVVEVHGGVDVAGSDDGQVVDELDVDEFLHEVDALPDHEFEFLEQLGFLLAHPELAEFLGRLLLLLGVKVIEHVQLRVLQTEFVVEHVQPFPKLTFSLTVHYFVRLII